MNATSQQIKYTRTWMLFESGNGVVVDLSLFSAPRENTRPIDAYVVTEVEGQLVTKSARRAAGAAYEAVNRYRSDLRPTVAGFDFAGNAPVTGESGGLAFAIALAKRLMEKDPGPVAATGIVESSHNGGPIRPVRGIEEKLQAASMVLPPGGWVFYPRENDKSISKTLKKQLAEKGLKLVPVSSVFEAVDILFSDNPPTSVAPTASTETLPKKAGLIAGLLAILLLICIGTGIAFWYPEFLGLENLTSPKSEKIIAQKEPQKEEVTPASETGKTNPDGKKPEIIKEQPPPEKKEPPVKGKDPETEINNYPPDDKDTPSEEKPTVDEKKPEETTLPGQDEVKPEKSGESPQPEIDISGESYLGTRVAALLTERLKSYFGPGQNPSENPAEVNVSGEVVVLSYEEYWVEEQQKFEYTLKAQIRKLSVKDDKTYRENQSEIIRVTADGGAEAVFSAAADSLLNRIVAKPARFEKNRPQPAMREPQPESGTKKPETEDRKPESGTRKKMETGFD